MHSLWENQTLKMKNNGQPERKWTVITFKMRFKNLIKTKHNRGEKRRGRIKEKPNRTF